ncbi:MAG: hypothetical protein KGL18_10760 [Burkholderiales bacterium]|nr:hypothetical protein [Burkholderiales bacterium]MDE1926273.1 hypothetical protein [Burkholderiales bacterium]MDE2157443.1 hypothetical protein [Burkholderiales bacterium]MDE2503437.1 hypothetical protein [Burkholderiales bacterium]
MNEEIEWFLSLPAEAAEAAPVRPLSAPAPMAEELLFEASRRITLRCGKSSITLYPNGKIALRGQYILSDAEGVNRIVGGQIDLN